MIRHFLSLLDFSPAELEHIIQLAIILKKDRANGHRQAFFERKTLGMIFEKSSTRTRVSFEAAMSEGGGSSIFLSPRDTQLGRGEPVEDTARVVSRMVDIIMVRTFEHEKLETFAQYSQVPVINALTDSYHPCQLLADLMTYWEHRGPIKGKTVAWIGDGNNMCRSYINAAKQFNFSLRIASPDGFQPELPEWINEVDVKFFTDPQLAIQDVDLVVTDVWASMGQENEQLIREAAFKGFIVTPTLMDQASSDALFMHCLPAHRGEEVSSEMLDDPRSVIWDEAENRLHSQKALMHVLLNGF
ncbi:MAG: ornithine carbamoyltransferase [Pseudomonadota bacterium]